VNHFSTIKPNLYGWFGFSTKTLDSEKGIFGDKEKDMTVYYYANDGSVHVDGE
jgi:hypothetical protein